MRRFAPWIALALVTVFVSLALGVRYLLVPADQAFEYGDGIRIQLLGISHEVVDGEERVTWGVEIMNGTGEPLDLEVSSTCRHAASPWESAPSGLAERGGERVRLPPPIAASVADSCPSPESGRWWVYTLTLEDGTGGTGGAGSRSVVFVGRAH